MRVAIFRFIDQLASDIGFKFATLVILYEPDAWFRSITASIRILTADRKQLVTTYTVKF